MKFMHISDLHIGKRVNGFSMLEDQRYILGQILAIADREKTDGIWIAGDIYDKTVPSAEAVGLFDDFLTAISARGIRCFIISGNHDSPERIAFGARLMERSGVYLSPVFGGEIEPVSLKDEYGELRIYLLPFLKPAHVRQAYPDAQIESFQDALAEVIGRICAEVGEAPDAETTETTETTGSTAAGKAEGGAVSTGEHPEGDERTDETGETAECLECAKRPDTETAEGTAAGSTAWDAGCRNVLLAHQFVAGAARCESEEMSVGGLDQVSADLFHAFDYVALGHIHTPQQIGRENIRYCGTPLKYSFSEAGTEKSVTIVELREKGTVEIRPVALRPLRDMRKIRGTYMELTARETYQGTAVEDYLQVTLTDEEDVPGALGKLRSIYPNIMKLEYDNQRTRANHAIEAGEDPGQKQPLELFAELYELQNNQPMSEEQRTFAQQLIEKIWEE